MYDFNETRTTKGMHVAHLNVRSMVNKWDNVKANFIDSNIHILSFSESWLHQLLPDNLFQLGNNYTLLRNDRNWNDENDPNSPPKKGGGVCTYVKNTLNYSETSYSHMNRSCKDLESQWISINQKPNKTILIGNCYRPPQGNIENCIDTLEEQLTNLDLSKVEIIITGDFNIDITGKNNESAKKFLSMMKDFGIRQLINEPTRYSSNKNSCLDLMFTNSDIIAKVGVSNLNLSDHQLVMLTRKKLKTIKQKCSFVGRSYRNYDKNNFQQLIMAADWSVYDESRNPTQKWYIMKNIIKEIIDEMCPIKSFRINQIKQPWITPPLLELIKDKDIALKNAKKTKNEQLWKEAKRLRNACTNRLRQAKADFIKDNLNHNQNDPKKFWQNIQEIIPNKSTNKKNIFLNNMDTNEPIELDRVADYINEYFINIGPNLATKCNGQWQYNGIESNNSLSDIHTSPEEMMNICKKININKASCIENLSSEILRDAFMVLTDRLSELFNACFDVAVIPPEWKFAKITPLPKPGDSTLVSNYRPISLLPLMSKLIEKVVHSRIYMHLEENDILDKRQGGFRPGHSTVTTCSYFINDIYSACNNNNFTIAVYIDAMKAFDTVNHNILLQKLDKIGIRGRLLDWIRNYLADRYQSTIANSTISNEQLIKCGVPQGSVLGPLLFLIYINDISKIITNSQVSLYADDTVLYLSHTDIESAIALLQSDLDKLQTWCDSNKLTINCKKTKFCLYGMRSLVRKAKMQDIQLSLNNQILEQVCSYKYLGLILDEHLNYNKHIKEMNKLISHKLYLLSKIRKYLTTKACIDIFKTMVLSVIEYYDIIYAGTSQGNLGKIDKLFYRGLKICTNRNEKQNKLDTLRECKIAPLKDRRLTHLLVFMHKCKHNDQLLKTQEIRTRLHNATVFYTYKPNNEKARSNVFYRGAIEWNKLPANNRNLDIDDFKQLQKKHLRNCFV